MDGGPAVGGCSPERRFPWDTCSVTVEKEISSFIRSKPQFVHLMKAFQPQRILEVGSWHGRSAVTFVWRARELGFETTVLCVDTWLGSREHWLDTWPNGEWSRDALMISDGEPKFFDQFKRNIKRFAMQKSISLLRTSSEVALAYLDMENMKFELVYVDGDHSFEGVREDLAGAAKLLDHGGIVSGDDWSWFSVRRAVIAFAIGTGHQVWLSGQTWTVTSRNDSRGSKLAKFGWRRLGFLALVLESLRMLLYKPYRFVRRAALRVVPGSSN